MENLRRQHMDELARYYERGNAEPYTDVIARGAMLIDATVAGACSVLNDATQSLRNQARANAGLRAAMRARRAIAPWI